jgi:hypothetical protein
LLAIRNLDERDVVLSAKRNNQLLVCLLLASLVQHAHVCLATVEGFGSFAQTAGETIVDEGDLEHTLERVEDGHAAGLGASISGDLDFIGGSHLVGGNIGDLFSVRLGGSVLVCVREVVSVKPLVKSSDTGLRIACPMSSSLESSISTQDWLMVNVGYAQDSPY